MTDKLQRRTKKVNAEIEGIKLDKKFRLMPLDDNNLELQEYISYTDKDKTKQKRWQFRSYHGSIPTAIKEYC